MFSICLNNVNGGYITIGGFDATLHQDNFSIIIPYDDSHNLYKIKIKQILINN